MDNNHLSIRNALPADLQLVAHHDRHISRQELENLIRMGRVSIVEIGDAFAGWLRWNLFWDNIPFLNMLYLLEPFRGKGYGHQIMTYWEAEMQNLGFDRVMTSTASDEYAQHFYQKLGYTALGGFTPFGDAYELIFGKIL